ncbi:MAG: hypothetical protein H5T99_00730 [Moorella sp. (in: Bacteria)]|nr:hypothetical protein [Moorella sp. (in: firmicutes)]
MRVAVTRWGLRVSPLFDTARQVTVYTLQGKDIVFRQEINVENVPPVLKADFLSGLGIQVLICGGISDFFLRQLLNGGVRVIPWVTGEVEDVLAAFIRDQLHRKRYLMPGCRGCRHRFRGGCGRRR